MGIYNRLKTQVWQRLGDNLNTVGPIVRDIDPDFTPTATGIIYVNTTTPAIWISSNTLDENCWRPIWP
jgi:hypothetical protein